MWQLDGTEWINLSLSLCYVVFSLVIYGEFSIFFVDLNSPNKFGLRGGSPTGDLMRHNFLIGHSATIKNNLLGKRLSNSTNLGEDYSRKSGDICTERSWCLHCFLRFGGCLSCVEICMQNSHRLYQWWHLMYILMWSWYSVDSVPIKIEIWLICSHYLFRTCAIFWCLLHPKTLKFVLN